jgi:2-phospho-L-lactate/phosphoenolpyruvate guanylyltransferase
MSLWAIVPVKPLRRGKSRLSGILSETERTVLNQSLLTNTLNILKQISRIDTILVVSRDPAALALARDISAKTVLEDGAPELNTALRRAAKVAEAYSVQELLILPADLPLLNSQDLNEFLNCAINPPEIVIAPDRRKDGTNALFLSPANLITFGYGPGSYQKHLTSAEQKGARIHIFEKMSLELDLDLPEDLELLKSLETSKPF